MDIRARLQAHLGDAFQVERTVQSADWKATAAVDRPYRAVIELFAAAERPDRARQLLAEYRAEVPGAENVPLTRALVAAREGEILLAEGKFDAAIERFRSTLRDPNGGPPSCETCGPIHLAQAFDKAGQPDSSIVWYERYLAVPPSRRLFAFQDANYLAGLRKRLGELYDAKGERAKAIAQYQAFVDQWADADPELQPTVASVRRRLEELKRLEG